MTDMRYYVYELIDTRDDKVFYVGKGSGDRWRQHEKDARKGVHGLKCDLIRAILESGNQVESRIAKRFTDEDEAFAYEKSLIASIGIDNLTNIASGGRVMSVETFQERKECRDATRVAAKLIRLCGAYSGFRVLYGGWRDVSVEVVTGAIADLLKKIIKVLGESETLNGLRKYGVDIEISIELTHAICERNFWKSWWAAERVGRGQASSAPAL